MIMTDSRKLISLNSPVIIPLAMVSEAQLAIALLIVDFTDPRFSGARRDEDGYLWITGRVDDKLNVSGHLMSTSEIEAVLTEHPDVAEAAAVSRPHSVKGESLYCFVTLNENATFDKKLVSELKKLIRERIGSFAQPDVIQYAPGLPKTRSGKIMRRVLRKVAVNDRNVGDTSTLADESIVEQLFANRPEN